MPGAPPRLRIVLARQRHEGRGLRMIRMRSTAGNFGFCRIWRARAKSCHHQIHRPGFDGSASTSGRPYRAVNPSRSGPSRRPDLHDYLHELAKHP